MNSLSIIHENILTIEKDYARVKSNIQEKLNEWSDLYVFDDAHNQIRYKTEGPLIPEDNGKIPISFLLSNPHPHSVKQGMFLSPNRIGRGNPFWDTLRNTGYFNYDGKIGAAGMIQNKYQSPFRLFMAVLLPFPSNFPDDLVDILGKAEYDELLINGINTLKQLLLNNEIYHVVCFGKLQYDAISQVNAPNSYTTFLNQDKIIESRSNFANDINIFLTYPTGWRFLKNARELKVHSLKRIFQRIQLETM
ncbi:MAG: hypothetical protein Q8O06_08475 [Acetobacterium sp.]|nr:hypothetical protein [Acetobacterium sp.]